MKITVFRQKKKTWDAGKPVYLHSPSCNDLTVVECASFGITPTVSSKGSGRGLVVRVLDSGL